MEIQVRIGKLYEIVIKNSCMDLIGGPLMSYNVGNNVPYWVLVGIVSYGPTQCGTVGVPGVYTKVSSFLEWIATNIRD